MGSEFKKMDDNFNRKMDLKYEKFILKNVNHKDFITISETLGNIIIFFNQEKEINKIVYFNKNNKIVKGIENLLNLDGISLEKFHKKKLSDSGYGVKSIIMEFEKMKFCEEICNMDNEKLKYIFT